MTGLALLVLSVAVAGVMGAAASLAVLIKRAVQQTIAHAVVVPADRWTDADDGPSCAAVICGPEDEPA